nr:hypothetical protein [Tanacetum cinerariifolium]
MEKSWMRTSRTKKQYIDGVEAFIKYAIHNLQKIRNIDPREFVDDIDFGSEIPTDGPTTVEMVNAIKESFDEDDLAKFQELLLDAEKPLYKGCHNFTKMSVIVKLLNLKGKYGASDKFFTELLGLLKRCYLLDNKELTVCSTCGISRWKVDNKTHKVYENIPAKRTIDEKFLEIAKDSRNLRLGISIDGVDVNSGTRHHSVWPDLSVIYHLSPWLCMKRKFIMLSILISGYPGNDIDVFLEPLVDDMHTLFKTGVDTYDASTQKKLFSACLCGIDKHCVRLSASSKQSYAGHRRYLPYNHPFRRKKKAFRGQQEFQLALNPLTDEQIYNKLRYWRHNSVPHCIDFMHVEKNVGESLVGTLLNVPGKTKDGMNARLDLAELGIKPELKETSLQELDKMQEELVVTLCLLEKFFPLLFFDIMIHLTVHLTREVERELAISKDSVSKTVRWISYGPRATIVIYKAYNINGYTFRTKSNDIIVYQNSEVSVEAVDLHISKDVATTRKAFYYGVLQEIWVLDNHFRQIPLFKCDWVNHKASGVKHDPNLGYTLVDLNSLGHKAGVSAAHEL